MLTINGHKEQPLWLDNLKQLVKVGENLDYHLLLSELRARIIAVRTIVNDAVHVEVQIVNYRRFANISWLVEQRVSFAQPAIEFRNPCRTLLRASLYKQNHRVVKSNSKDDKRTHGGGSCVQRMSTSPALSHRASLNLGRYCAD